MPRIVGWVAIIAVVAIAAAWIWMQRSQPILTPAPPAIEPPAPSAGEAQPKIQFPVPPVATPKPLPALDQSDAQLREALSGVGAEPNWLEKAVFEDFVRRVVATVDSLTTPKIPLRLLPVKTAPGKFVAAVDTDGIRLKPENSMRYAAYMRVLEAVDPARVVALYVQYYPLFQQAYQELGYPNGYFNDRLVAVIDHLLVTPPVQAPVRLVQPEVMYRYADPELEARSAGQKLLMRIGNANAAIVKEKLRAIRRELVAAPPPPPG
ncbi:MAG: DUF3014 domain-containing protein [Betaproteobacteria bacterium]|nr:DUF3014 domain-containing protein [Betaproteobacteria bacterium]